MLSPIPQWVTKRAVAGGECVVSLGDPDHLGRAVSSPAWESGQDLPVRHKVGVSRLLLWPSALQIS